MRRLSIPEILDSLETKESNERIQILRKNDSKSLRHILHVSFNPHVQIILPNERPTQLKIEESPVGLSSNTLYQQSRKLKIFLKDTGYDHLSNSKRESLFTQILESIHSSEAELLLQICVDRKLKSSLTYEEVSEAFPELLPVVEVTSEPEPVVEVAAEEEQPKVYKNLQELYKEEIPKAKAKAKEKSKKSKNKKSSKKKSK
ncbi:MAG: hypothetical protein CMP21_04070 [Rickettsiales bacterium]|nr:hypothetical protein [Rickettsiales bacterium]|tara:strand:+ start:13804 stop:14409 length:606 start_codon:yes stop_codon:yes gene_type:complete